MVPRAVPPPFGAECGRQSCRTARLPAARYRDSPEYSSQHAILMQSDSCQSGLQVVMPGLAMKSRSCHCPRRAHLAFQGSSQPRHRGKIETTRFESAFLFFCGCPILGPTHWRVDGLNDEGQSRRPFAARLPLPHGLCLADSGNEGNDLPEAKALGLCIDVPPLGMRNQDASMRDGSTEGVRFGCHQYMQHNPGQGPCSSTQTMAQYTGCPLPLGPWLVENWLRLPWVRWHARG